MGAQLQRLVRDHVRELRGSEFKVAVYLYGLLESQDTVEMKIADISTAVGVSWKQTQVALQKLNEKGILRVEGGRGRTTWCRLPVVVGPAESGPTPTADQEEGKPKLGPAPTATLSDTEPLAADHDAIGQSSVLSPSAAAKHASGTGVVENQPTQFSLSFSGQKSGTELGPTSSATAASMPPDPGRESIELITRVCLRPDADYLRKADEMAGGRDKLLECLRFTVERNLSFETGELLLCHIYDQCHIPHSEFANWFRFCGKK